MENTIPKVGENKKENVEKITAEETLQIFEKVLVGGGVVMNYFRILERDGATVVEYSIENAQGSDIEVSGTIAPISGGIKFLDKNLTKVPEYMRKQIEEWLDSFPEDLFNHLKEKYKEKEIENITMWDTSLLVRFKN